MKIKVVARGDSPEIWDYYLARQDAIRQLISTSVGGGRLRVKEFRIVKGSIEIILIVAIIKLTIAVIGLIVAILAAFRDYDKIKANFNDARIDCAAFIEKLTYRLRELFGGYGAPGPATT